MRPSVLAKFHAGLIIKSALDSGWEPAEKYSRLKRARIVMEMNKLKFWLLTGKRKGFDASNDVPPLQTRSNHDRP